MAVACFFEAVALWDVRVFCRGRHRAVVSAVVQMIFGVSDAGMCSDIAQKSVESEDLLMRRRRYWHMRRPGDADGLLAGREEPAAPHHLHTC